MPENQPRDQSLISTLPLRLSLILPTTIPRTRPVLAMVGIRRTSKISAIHDAQEESMASGRCAGWRNARRGWGIWRSLEGALASSHGGYRLMLRMNTLARLDTHEAEKVRIVNVSRGVATW